VYIIVGLGNPGLKYDRTRHNIGFEVIDKLASINKIKLDKEKFRAIIGEGKIGNEKVILVMPLTFMNLSGDSVQGILGFYKLTTEDIIVIYDDISLEVGKIRIREKGSSGGHNGMKDIINKIGSDTFSRIRVGIGERPQNWDLADYVLSPFRKEEQDLINIATTNACDAIELIIKEGNAKAMNKYN